MLNSFQHRGVIPIRYFLIFLVMVALLVPAAGYAALAQQADKPWYEVRTIYTEDVGLSHPEGLTFSPDANAFLLWQEDGAAEGITMYEEPIDIQGLNVPAADVRNIAFNGQTNQLFALGSDNMQLKEIPVGANGLPLQKSAATVQTHKLDKVNLQAARGITFDPVTGRMFVLNANGTQLVVTPNPAAGLASGAKVSTISLKALNAGSLEGIAFNPQDGHLYLSDQANQRLYELTQAGRKVAEYDLSSLQLASPKTLVFAPSADRTDAPSNMNLFLLDSGQPASKSGQIVELSLAAPAQLPAGTTLLPTRLIHVINTSNTAWNPSAPDATGIDYWPLKGKLLMADSEVEEMPAYWQGKNVFQLTTSGALVSTCSTLAFTPEPTGLAINPTNNHIFFSDDGDDLIYEVNIGGDGVYCTSDDIVTETNLFNLYGITDAEDVAYGNNTIFVAGGSSAEVYSIPLGINRVLGGGDDGAITHFDTSILGFNILEGLGYNADNGTLLLVSSQQSDKYLGETTTSGALLRVYDLAAYTGLTHREDVTFAPGSQNPAIKNLYITDRGTDNNQDRNENDGEVYEINIGAATPTSTPTLRPSPTTTRTPTATATIPPSLYNIAVQINGNPAVGSPFSMAAGGSRRESLTGIAAGPVQLNSNVNIVAAERVLYTVQNVNTSYSELMALPNNQLDSIYWLPWYNSTGLDSRLHLTNVSNSIATVQVTIGGMPVAGSPFTLQMGENLEKIFPGIDNGPVKIQSNVNIVASERVIYKVNGINTSYSELMALPEKALDTTYWLPWYNNVGLDSQLRIANISNLAATVQVTIGGAPVAGSPFALQPGESLRRSFPGIDSGPVKIQSNVNIVASERTIYKVNGINTSYSESMALSNNQLDTTYWLPWYNNASLDSQLRFANVSTSTATVHVVIGGVTVPGSPFILAPGQSFRGGFPGIDSGPVKIQSNVSIVASERVIYRVNGIQTSYSESMALPNGLLDAIYWLPWYDNVDFDTQLRFGLP